MGEVLFLGLITVIICSAFWVVISPNLVHSAVSLLVTLFGIAGLYVFLYADFLAATQIVIYVGGILVLIIFGVMLTNKIDDATIKSPTHNRIPGIISCLVVLYIQFMVILNTDWYRGEEFVRESTIKDVGNLLLTKYLLPFEVVSILLLAALIGAAMLSRKKVDQK